MLWLVFWKHGSEEGVREISLSSTCLTQNICRFIGLILGCGSDRDIAIFWHGLIGCAFSDQWEVSEGSCSGAS
jgi:hypothetical protein